MFISHSFFREVEKLRLLSIQNALQATLRQTDINEESDLSNSGPEFDYAFAPTCKFFE